MIDININVGGVEKGKGLMGMSFDDLLEDKPVIVRKGKKRKRKSAIAKAVESAVPKKSSYTTEVV